MKKKCKKCGMIRSIKDLVKLNEHEYMCFACWNEDLRSRNLIQ